MPVKDKRVGSSSRQGKSSDHNVMQIWGLQEEKGKEGGPSRKSLRLQRKSWPGEWGGPCKDCALEESCIEWNWPNTTTLTLFSHWLWDGEGGYWAWPQDCRWKVWQLKAVSQQLKAGPRASSPTSGHDTVGGDLEESWEWRLDGFELRVDRKWESGDASFLMMLSESGRGNARTTATGN